jgi:hypothetical protein
VCAKSVSITSREALIARCWGKLRSTLCWAKRLGRELGPNRRLKFRPWLPHSEESGPQEAWIRKLPGLTVSRICEDGEATASGRIGRSPEIFSCWGVGGSSGGQSLPESLLARVFPARVPTSNVRPRILVKLLMFRGLPEIHTLATVEHLVRA